MHLLIKALKTIYVPLEHASIHTPKKNTA